MVNKIFVGLIGYGTVGSGTVETLIDNQTTIFEKTGVELVVKTVCDLRIDELKSDEYVKRIPVHTKNVDDVINDPEISIIVELIGGYEPARTFIIRALEAGKHVVTANKALMAVHGPDLYKAAQKTGTVIGFEGSVGGGIPIIRVMKEDMAGNNIESFKGIMNGTANYILTEMEEKGTDFDTVLKDAQQLGYAEADPTFDIEGIDTAHKAAVLASIAFSTLVPFEKIYTEGISSIKPVDIEFAKKLNCRIKLLAIAKKHEDDIEVRVHPTIIPNSEMLAQVSGVFNAIEVQCDKLDKTLHYGRGAGAEPTGSAVVGDIIAIARDIKSGGSKRVPVLGFNKEYTYYYPVRDINDIESSYYLRFSAVDETGSFGTIASVLGKHGISISQAIQTSAHNPGNTVPLVLMTHKVEGRNVTKAVEELGKLDVIQDETVVIRVEGLE